jgi:hypothetical protein
VKRFQEVTAEISGRDFRRAPRRKVELISGGHHRDKCNIFQEVTAKISATDFRRSPQ